jgi:hypothetical protein
VHTNGEGENATTPGAGEGWYYDDFSEKLEECRPGRPRRIAFSPMARPPNGVRVYLDCADTDAAP